MPNLSTTITSVAPAAISLRVIERPAEPPPLTTILTSSKVLDTNFRLLKTAAKTTIAVPC